MGTRKIKKRVSQDQNNKEDMKNKHISRRKRSTKKIILLHAEVLVLCAVYILVCELLGIGCPIRRIIRIPCPSCGITRAYYYVAKLDFATAFKYHPLYVFIPLYVLLIMHEKVSPLSRINKYIKRVFIIGGVVLIALVYIYRIIYGFGPV